MKERLLRRSRDMCSSTASQGCSRKERPTAFHDALVLQRQR